MSGGEPHRPRVGDKVWNRPQFNDFGLQCNGKITYVDYPEQEVLVTYEGDGGTETFSFDDLEGLWEETLGGIYLIHPSISPTKG